jgi:hypothetical protein
MNGGRDEPGEMRSSPLDELTADQLLGGSLAPDEAPAGWASVARLVLAARGPAEAGETADEPLVVSAMVDAILGESTVVPLERRRGMSRFRTTRVAGLAAAVVIVTATAAAAATNSLPRPAQTAVSDAAAHVGVSLPKPAPTPAPVNDHDADDTPAAQGGTATTPTTADHDASRGAASASPASVAGCRNVGLVRPGDPQASSPAYRALAAAAAKAAESVADYCRGLVHGATSSSPASTSTTEAGHRQHQHGDGGPPQGSPQGSSPGGPGSAGNPGSDGGTNPRRSISQGSNGPGVNGQGSDGQGSDGQASNSQGSNAEGSDGQGSNGVTGPSTTAGPDTGGHVSGPEPVHGH